MAFSEETYQQIQRYLDQDLSPEELAAFEKEMQENEVLAAEVKLQQEMEELLADTPENNLRKNLQLLNDQVVEETDKKGWNWKSALWLLPVLLVAVWWFVGPDNISESDLDTPIIEPTKPVESEASQQIIEENKIEEEDSKPLEQDTEKSGNSNNKEQDKIENTSPPIAANFEPNASLEFLISNPTRSNTVELKIEKKQANVTLSTADQIVTFQFAGQLISTENLVQKAFKLHIFSNNKQAFQDFEPLLTEAIQLTLVSANTYQVDLQKQIQLTPGLYYYLLEDFELEKIYLVEKFEVRSIN